MHQIIIACDSKNPHTPSENHAGSKIIDGLSRDGASGQQATLLEEEAEAEGPLRLRPSGSPHTAAADHPLAVCGITEEIQRCAYVRTV